MSLRLYEDPDLDQIVTLRNDFTNPDDEDDINGDAGATKYKYLYAALECGKLAAGMDDSQEEMTLAAARFADTSMFIGLIGTEKVRFLTGFGATSFTVERGYKGTTKAEHASGATVWLCYQAIAGKVLSYDVESPDEASMMTFCLAPGGVPDDNYNAHPDPLLLGNINPGQIIQIRRRLIVPSGWSPIEKVDLMAKAYADFKEYTAA